MAKIISNPIIQGLSGGLGRDLMFRRLKDGRTILCVKPDFSRRKLSDEQKTHHKRFRQAAAYAREAAKTQPRYAELAANTMKTAYNVALSDWFHPPVIHSIALQGSLVRVHASDNVQVVRVRVTLVDGQGNALEQGEASPTSSANQRWEYNARSTVQPGVRVLAEAWDLAGNVTKHEQPGQG